MFSTELGEKFVWDPYLEKMTINPVYTEKIEAYTKIRNVILMFKLVG